MNIKDFITTPSTRRDIAIAVTVAAIVATVRLSGFQLDSPGAGGLLIAGPLLLAALPVLIAAGRRHHQIGLISVLAVLGIIPVIGWVLWIVALVMAAATSPVPVPRVAAGPVPGQVIDGRVLTVDGRWVPLG